MARRMLLVAVALLLPVFALQSAVPQDALPPVAEWIPSSAVAVLEITDPQAALDLVLNPKFVDTITATDAYQKATTQPGFQQFLGLIRYLEMRLKVDWQTAARKLVGGGVTVALAPQEGVLIVIDSQDATLLDRLHAVFLEFAQGGADHRVESREYRGVTGWTFNRGKEAHAIIGNRLLLSNKPALLKAAVDLREDGPAGSLASLPLYQQARESLGDHCARLFVNMEVVKKAPGVARAMEQGNRNPMGVLLLDGLVGALHDSSYLALGFSAKDHGVLLTARTDGKFDQQSHGAAFAVPADASDGAMPNLQVPRRIAAATLYRDLAQFYSAKDELFPERTSGLIFFENMMGIFFTGRHLTDEVLAETEPHIRAVVAQQAYDTAVGTPSVKIPAFALVFRMKRPEHFSIIVEEAWQKALGLINFTQGQQAKPGLIIDRREHQGVKYTTAYYSMVGIDDRANLEPRFNFQPTLATVGPWLVMSSAEGLARDVIDALQKETQAGTKALAGVGTLVELDARQLASLLEENLDNLIRQNMIEKGHSQEQAEGEIGALMAVVRALGEASLQIGSEAGSPSASLKVTLNVAGPAK